jgi:type 1 glutamine amidotransferase
LPLAHDRVPPRRHPLRDRATSPHGAEAAFDLTATEDPATFNDPSLASFKVVVFLLTTGTILDNTQRSAFERFIARGGGYVGVHSVADT